MVEPVIVAIFDFDGTLAPDSITYLLKESNIDAVDFWKNITKMVKEGWDPPIASMTRILEFVRGGTLDLTKNRMHELGHKLKPFFGLPEMFEQLQQMVKDTGEFSDAGIKLEFYIISGGLEEIIRGNPIAKHMTGIFGCTFEHDNKTNQPVAIKSAISFTEKTRFLLGINKGFSESELRTRPYIVNDVLKEEERRVPLDHMIYIGDGPSDIPCFSLVYSRRGDTIGIRRLKRQKGEISKGYEMSRGERTRQGPYTADYRENTDMRIAIEDSIISIGYDIVVKRKERRISSSLPG
jgi:phosphoserine phosphatase